jgi:hypothetical protein
MSSNNYGVFMKEIDADFIENFDSSLEYKSMDVEAGSGFYVPDLPDIEEAPGEIVSGATVLAMMKSRGGRVYAFGNGHTGVCLEYQGVNRYFVEAQAHLKAEGA